MRKYKVRRYALVLAGATLGLLAGLTITLAVQERHDRALMAEIDRTSADLRATGEQDANLITMSDYISAYAQIEHLQNDYDQKVSKFADLCNLGQQRDGHRGLINLLRLHSGYHPETWQNMAEIVGLVRQINEITKRAIAVAHSMTALPENERVQFWHGHFMPLATEEHALRQQLLVTGQSTPP